MLMFPIYFPIAAVMKECLQINNHYVAKHMNTTLTDEEITT